MQKTREDGDGVKHTKPRQLTTGSAEIADLFTKAAICMYLVTGNKTESYRVYNLGIREQQKKTANQKTAAVNWFNKDNVKITLDVLSKVAQEKLVSKYLVELGITQPRIDALLRNSQADMDNFCQEDISRENVVKDLQEVAKYAEKDSDRIAAYKAIADIEAMKKQESKDDGKDGIIYYLPLRLCDKCPHQNEILSQFSDNDAEIVDAQPIEPQVVEPIEEDKEEEEDDSTEEYEDTEAEEL